MSNGATYRWQPIPAVLEKVKQYFLGFVHFEREIHARRWRIAQRLEMGERTLDRYLKYLRDTGWMLTVRRTPRTAIRSVKSPAYSAAAGGSLADQNGAAGGSLADHIRENYQKHNLERKAEGRKPPLREKAKRMDAHPEPEREVRLRELLERARPETLREVQRYRASFSTEQLVMCLEAAELRFVGRVA